MTEMTPESRTDSTHGPNVAPMHWFDRVWQSMHEEDQARVRDKAKWEHMTLMAVLVDWPSFAPVGLRDLIPPPEREA